MATVKTAIPLESELFRKATRAARKAHVSRSGLAQARVAREAYRDFGKGSGHPAGLNFGDCLAYALARVADEPLLYKGTDFGHTDVRSAIWSVCKLGTDHRVMLRIARGAGC